MEKKTTTQSEGTQTILAGSVIAPAPVGGGSATGSPRRRRARATRRRRCTRSAPGRGAMKYESSFLTGGAVDAREASRRLERALERWGRDGGEMGERCVEARLEHALTKREKIVPRLLGAAATMPRGERLANQTRTHMLGNMFYAAVVPCSERLGAECVDQPRRPHRQPRLVNENTMSMSNVSAIRRPHRRPQASHMRCSSRAISEYFSSTYSRLSAETQSTDAWSHLRVR